MKIITGFYHPMTPEWNKALGNLRSSAWVKGYSIEIHPLPTEDKWIVSIPEIYISLCWKYKLIFLIEQLEQGDDDLLWIDGDCLINKSIDFHKVMQGCDIAMTLRDINDRSNTKERQRDGYLNSGVIFMRNNQASKSFLKECRKKLLCAVYDQEAFNIILLEQSKLEQYGEIVNIKGALIKILNCREYNNFYHDDTFNHAIIQHYKSSKRAEYKTIYGVKL